MTRFDILIGGGSFAGLALARALAASLDGELRVAVIERQRLDMAASPRPDGRAVTLSAASVRLLTALGVWPKVAARAQPIAAIDITDTSLDATIRPPVLSYRNQLEAGEAAAIVIEAPILRRALVEAVRESDGVTLFDDETIGRFVAEDARVQVELSRAGTLAGALMVAADGRDSGLAAAAGIKYVGWRHDQLGIITTVAHELAHEGRATQHFLPAGPFAILPLPGHRACVTWTEAADRGQAIMAFDDAGFLAELEARFGGRLGTVSLDGPRSAYPLDTRLARSYVARRLALIGDAAHVVHPIGGQGLNLALRDVAALAEVIADTARLGLDIGAGAPLERYQRWRRFDSVASAAAMDGLNRVFSNDWVLARTVRDAGAGLIDRLPAVKAALVRQAAGVAGEVPRLLDGRLA